MTFVHFSFGILSFFLNQRCLLWNLSLVFKIFIHGIWDMSACPCYFILWSQLLLSNFVFKMYVFTLKACKEERGRRRERYGSSIHWLNPQIATMARAWCHWSQGPEAPFMSHMFVAWAQGLRTSSTAFSGH